MPRAATIGMLLDLEHRYQTYSVPRKAAKGLTHVGLFRPKDRHNDLSTLVMFVHSTGNDAYYPNFVLFRALLAAGLPVLTFDLDGHGNKSTTVFSSQTISSMLPDIVDWVLKNLQVTKLHLVGVSLGAALVLDYSRNPRAELASITMLSLPKDVQGVSLKLAAQELSAIFHSVFWSHVGYYGLRHFMPALGRFRRWEFPVRLVTPGQGFFYYLDAVQEYFAAREGLDASSFPKQLLLAGSWDSLAKYEATSGLKVVILPHLTHFSCQLSETCAELVVSFLCSP